MQIKTRLLSVLLVIAMAAGAIFGSKGEIKSLNREEQEDEIWTSKKETIYVWYGDEALEN